MLRESYLNYEDLYTLIVQVEATLNSRPITPMSNDINDFNPLTPAHFLVMDSLASTPQTSLVEENIPSFKRYERIQKILKGFWQRWEQEYLSEMMKRNKWRTNTHDSPKTGDLVILIDDTKRVLHWPMARIMEVHPGEDNIVRVVTVKCANGTTFKRAVTKIAVLPKGEA